MSINSKMDGSKLTIAVSDKFDFSVHQDFRIAYETQNPKPTAYEIDLGNTTYLDSSALGMLLLLRDFAGDNASNIHIINCNDDIRKILEISNFEQLFQIS